jgi:hypothetical protein
MNLVQDHDCQCNYQLKGGDRGSWEPWVDHWLKNAAPKPTSAWQIWFKQSKAPSYALNYAACWVNNPRDMINLQNSLWRKKLEWSSQVMPKSDWQNGDAASQRVYWGWNEIPVARADMDAPKNWDAIIIKLPGAICGGDGKNDTASCLSAGAQALLERDLAAYVKAGFLMVGANFTTAKPGSALVFLREILGADGTWTREFYCQNWTAPSGKRSVVATNGGKACHLE